MVSSLSATVRRQRKKREALRYAARETEALLVGPVVGMRVEFNGSFECRGAAWRGASGRITEVTRTTFEVSWDARPAISYDLNAFGSRATIWLARPR